MLVMAAIAMASNMLSPSELDHSGCEMTALATARHETINSRLKVWAIVRNAYRYGQGEEERLARHERTVCAIANVTNIWLAESPAFQIEDYDDAGATDNLYY